MPGVEESGRVAQRRRTRAAIVAAAARLLRDRADMPSVADIAAAADVSRRTVYMYFPTLDQLVLDATLGTLGATVDAALTVAEHDDPRVAVERRLAAICKETVRTMAQGRTLIRLTVDTPPADDGPKRGYRRIGWLEQAIEPVRGQLSSRATERLVSSLSMVVGWEAVVVLQDVRGMTGEQARRHALATALTLVDAALAESAAR